MSYKNTIGYQNNNYGNIRINPRITWQGQRGENKGFVIFDTPENGLRAIARILLTYKRRGLDTLEKILKTYAPETENKTALYIANVSKWTGLSAKQKLILDRAQLSAIIKAISRQEISLTPTDEQVNKALDSLSKSPLLKTAKNIIPIFVVGIIGLLLLLKK